MPQKTEDLPMKLVMFNNHLVEFLVGGLEHGFYFPCHIWDIILPIDELIFFKMATLHHQPDKLNMLTRHILTWVNQSDRICDRRPRCSWDQTIGHIVLFHVYDTYTLCVYIYICNLLFDIYIYPYSIHNICISTFYNNNNNNNNNNDLYIYIHISIYTYAYIHDSKV